MTRYLVHAFWRREKSWLDARRHVETCCARRTARCDTLVTTSATGVTRTTRVQGHHHSVDWGGHVHLIFSRNCSRDWCKPRAQKTKLVHASTTASSSFAILEKARLDTHDTSYVSCRVAMWRDESSGIWALRRPRDGEWILMDMVLRFMSFCTRQRDVAKVTKNDVVVPATLHCALHYDALTLSVSVQIHAALYCWVILWKYENPTLF